MSVERCARRTPGRAVRVLVAEPAQHVCDGRALLGGERLDECVEALQTEALAVGHGYRVVEAESSEEALAEIAGHDGALDLLLTDVMMTGIDGGQLARHLIRQRPDLRVLFMSGYADPAVEQALPFGCELLEKPFTAHTLLSRVRDVLSMAITPHA